MPRFRAAPSLTPKPGLSEEYLAYLASPEWAAKRQRVMDQYGGRCQMCGERATQVHHLSYHRFGREWDSDLLPLCAACHERADALRWRFTCWLRGWHANWRFVPLALHWHEFLVSVVGQTEVVE